MKLALVVFREKNLWSLVLLFVFWMTALVGYAQTSIDKKAIETTRRYALEITKKSYPEINTEKIHVKAFRSETTFFKARFSFGRFFTFRKMRHLIYVNSLVFEKNAPDLGVRSIIAHELAHVSYYTRKNRLELLGLSSLVSKGFTSKFERKADLEAIARGYGRGLIEYRKWLYKNIPKSKLKAKRRNYFSPEEIKVMLEVLQRKPSIIDVWRKKIPRNLEEIKKNA